MRILVVAVLAMLLCFQSARAEEPVEIPLENIWGFDRARRELEPELFIKRDTPEKRAEYSTPETLQEIRDKAQSSLTYQIERAMHRNVLNESKEEAYEKRRPAPGFAVAGRDMEAWKGVHEVVVNQSEPQSKFSQNDEISLVFFTLTSTAGVRLIHADRSGARIDLQYVLIITGLFDSHANLFMVPVGKLPPGEYEVHPVRAHENEVEHTERNLPVYEEGVEQHFVCRPFAFVVLENNSPRTD